MFGSKLLEEGLRGTLPDCGQSQVSPILLPFGSFCYAMHFGISSGGSAPLFQLKMV